MAVDRYEIMVPQHLLRVNEQPNPRCKEVGQTTFLIKDARA